MSLLQVAQPLRGGQRPETAPCCGGRREPEAQALQLTWWQGVATQAAPAPGSSATSRVEISMQGVRPWRPCRHAGGWVSPESYSA